MPDVPRYSALQIQPRAIPDIRISPNVPIEVFGGGPELDRTNEAVQNLITVGEKIAEKEQKKADAAITADAYSNALKSYNDLFYNPDSGVVSKKGKSTFQNPDGTPYDFIGDYNGKLKKSLGDIKKQFIFTQGSQEVWNQIEHKLTGEFDQQLNKHYAIQRDHYDKESTASLETSAYEDSVKNYDQPGRVEDNFKKVESKFVGTYGNQLSPEGLSDSLLKYRSKTYRGIIESQADGGNYLGAKETFDRVTGKAFPGMVEKPTIDWKSLPQTTNANGTISSTVTMGIGGDNGQEILIPRFWDGELHTQDAAIARYNETGDHLGVFKDTESAMNYVKNDLHPAQERKGRGLAYENLTVADQNHLEKVLKVSIIEGESQRISDELRQQYPGNIRSQENEVQKIKDPNIRDAVQKRIEHNFNIDQEVDRYNRDNMLRSDYMAVRKAKDASSLVVPNSHRALYSISENNALDNAAKIDLQTDRGEYDSMMRLFSNPATREEAANLDLTKSPAAHFADKDFYHFEKLQADLKQQTGSSDNVLNSTHAKYAAIDSVAQSVLKIPVGKKKGVRSEELNQFTSSVLDKVAQEESTGAKLNAKDYERIANDIAVKAITEKSFLGFGYSGKTPIYKLPPGSPVNIEPKDVKIIPKFWRDSLTQAFQSQNPPIIVNDENLKKAYIQILKLQNESK